MFGEVVGVDAGAIIGLDQAQPILVVLAERQARMVQVIEYAEFHWFPPRRLTSVSETKCAKATGGLDRIKGSPPLDLEDLVGLGPAGGDDLDIGALGLPNQRARQRRCDRDSAL